MHKLIGAMIPGMAAAVACAQCGDWVQLGNGPANYAHATAFDSARGVGVMYGGNMGCPVGGTWEFDGTAWSPTASVGDPGPRGGHMMTYDPVRQRVLMVGGAPNCFPPVLLEDTWEYDGTTWTLVAATGPGGIEAAALAFDETNGMAVLFGGNRSGGAFSDETWIWDGATWTQASPTNRPSPRCNSGMAFDRTIGKVVLYGGYRNYYTEQYTDTWTWDGSDWHLLDENGGSTIQKTTRMVFDSAANRLVRYDGNNTPAFSELRVWNGSSWIAVTAEAPPARYNFAMFFDEVAGRSIIQGGHNATTLVSDTWGYAEPADRPSINSQPDDQTLDLGATAHFSVAATAPCSVTYQWRRNGSNLLNGGRISGAKTASLQITAVEPADTGLYDCLVSACGCSIPSGAAELLVICPSDFDRSGYVDTDDYTAFVTAFEIGEDDADFDKSGFVDTDDFTAFVLAFEAGC